MAHVQGHVRRGSGKTLEAFPEDFDNPVLPYSLQPAESYLRNLGNKTANSHIVQLTVEARHTVGLFHRWLR